MGIPERMPAPTLFRSLLLLMFAASGFSGLIYESLWTHYLKLFLGHAAYAQTLVLAIFMGGMALGAWTCSRFSRSWSNLLRGYAIAEAAIGILALLFHPLFVLFLDWAYGWLIPALGPSGLLDPVRWGLSALLILPQTLLLGMTFPLMAAGLIRRFPHNSGSTLSILYFTNSLGAALGVLAGSFLLVPWVGLPGTLAIAGCINLLAATAVWALAGAAVEPSMEARSRPRSPDSGQTTLRPVLFLWLAALTGAASLIYEISWIRLLSLVLGSTTHSFELMLSAFITGLALGGLWIRRRIDRLDSPIALLAGIQVAMGILALATLPLYSQTFRWMGWLTENLPRTDLGYAWFSLASHGIAMAIMLPATFCAGTTLPLITHVLLRRGFGERSIGAVYSWNTVGAIAGVFLAVHLGMDLLGLKGLLVLGAAIDIAAGMALARGFLNHRFFRLAAGAGLLALLSAVGLSLDSYKMASGVYRTGRLLDRENSQLLYHRDGKTATVSVVRTADGVTGLRTNGKTDAGLVMDWTSSPNEDEATLVLLAALPLALNPQLESVANIGMGSGVTTHTLLLSPTPLRIDTIEIEPRMVEAARLFSPRNSRAFEDPRSRIHFDDAKAFFATSQRRYDLIVSEPSNLWVSGVSSLFSLEFYRRIREHLTDDGLLAQWLHLYEVDLDLVLSILKALSREFEAFDIYTVNSGDLIIVAGASERLPRLHQAPFQHPELERQLERIGVLGSADLEVRWLTNRRALAPLLSQPDPPTHSDYHPVVEDRAPRTRFRHSNARELLDMSLVQVPVFEMLGEHRVKRSPSPAGFDGFVERTIAVQMSRLLRDYYLGGEWPPDVRFPESIREHASLVHQILQDCSQPISAESWMDSMYNSLAKRVVPFLSQEELSPIWTTLQAEPCQSRLDPVQTRFLLLLQALSRQDGPAMAGQAGWMLENLGDRLHPALRDYLLSSGMLGLLAQADRAAAQRLWQVHRDGLSPADADSFRLRLLLAHARRQ